MIKYRFSKEINKQFSTDLKKRVSSYFKDNNLDQRANSSMITKTILIVGSYIGVYLSVIFGGITNELIMFFLWILLGLGQTFIGTAVMHDVAHGSFSKNKYVNAFMQIPIALIGVETNIWKIQHNVLHHTYTNIEHADEDIASRYVLRMTENQPRKWFHKYQVYYVTFLYSLLTIIWMTVKDFIKLNTYHKESLISTKKAFITFANIIIRRALYYILFLIVPIYVLNFSSLQVFMMFLTMLLTSGLALSIIFQTAHVLQECVSLQQDEKLIKENWYVHQLLTTSNYAVNNKWITYFFGGLNFQVEHHLFPNISHVHYPAISKIVKATAKEYNIPYNCKETFGAALSSHYKHLNELGKNDSVIAKSTFCYT